MKTFTIIFLTLFTFLFSEIHDVSIVNSTFSPSTLEIAVGDIVIWTNAYSSTHTVTSDDEIFSSGNLSSGDTFQYQFTSVGEFPYHCDFHPTSMTGTITVQ